jgi:hypothetical protein
VARKQIHSKIEIQNPLQKLNKATTMSAPKPPNASTQPGFYHRCAGIAVDYWEQADMPPEIDYFFLSHAHTDQMSGLNDTWPNTIFTSEVTKNVLHVIYPKIPKGVCLFV